MLSKKEIKDIQSLSQKKHREELMSFIAEGPKIVGEFIQLIPTQIEKIYATKDWLKTNASLLPDKTLEVSEKELERISQLKTPNKILAIVKQFQNIEPVAYDFILYLDTIQDPGNLGTIIRIADWFNVKNIVCSEGCADMYNSKIVQSSMASLARVKIYYDKNDKWLLKQNIPIYAASLNGQSLYDHPKILNGILLIGNESKGIRQEYMDLAKFKITIPRQGNAESLNAAVATGIILSHLLT
ncbi:MAG: TrmH family RNA methyltransferase [Flavisolibacter sp.]